MSVRCKGQLVAQDTTARSGDTTRSGDTALAGDTTGPRLGHALTPTTLKLLTSLARKRMMRTKWIDQASQETWKDQASQVGAHDLS